MCAGDGGNGGRVGGRAGGLLRGSVPRLTGLGIAGSSLAWRPDTTDPGDF